MDPEASSQPPARASDQKFCHSCAIPIHLSAATCPRCGAAQLPLGAVVPMAAAETYQPAAPMTQRTTSDQIFCHGCGTILHSTAPTCPKCGAVQHGAVGKIKSRGLAAMLALFLGGLGIHKFYCGHIGWGILYIVFCWTWIPAIVGFVEGIIYLASTSSDQEFTKKYCAQ